MKKLLLIIATLASALFASAQEKDSLQVQAATISIDSLSVRLDRLQHDYNFLYCTYKVDKLNMDLKDFFHSIDISSSRVVVNVYHGRYDRDLYNSFLGDYESSCNLLDIMKKHAEVVKTEVLLKIITSDFSEQEHGVLVSGLELIEKAIKKSEYSLNYYKTTIDTYRDKRW